jgi:hypothetical protein
MNIGNSAGALFLNFRFDPADLLHEVLFATTLTETRISVKVQEPSRDGDRPPGTGAGVPALQSRRRWSAGREHAEAWTTNGGSL